MMLDYSISSESSFLENFHNNDNDNNCQYHCKYDCKTRPNRNCRFLFVKNKFYRSSQEPSIRYYSTNHDSMGGNVYYVKDAVGVKKNREAPILY